MTYLYVPKSSTEQTHPFLRSGIISARDRYRFVSDDGLVAGIHMVQAAAIHKGVHALKILMFYHLQVLHHSQ
jgi:hypothetical protein